MVDGTLNRGSELVGGNPIICSSECASVSS